ncbi:hypothetical protein [Actinomadura rudentiformis]|uniref:Uncharacterized protein n=1 Tax=Actinomadura rudentiformis TaxID=359158 RepID=A0A6H9Z1W7_9ACTN|nr:hypothetical protein [Actinomadura rudentiformis]KAB2347257.1 hypothetical protein F8566_19735 [Actinomadura rudentiformis]
MADIFPPVDQWPVLQPPDCPTCQATTGVVFIGPADRIDGGTVNLWHCRACPADWTTPITHWPVLDGPDCPYCNSTDTCWAAIAPDHRGDLWTCPQDHEFVLTPEGIVITPGNEDLSEWAPVWPTTRRDPQDGGA